MHYQSVGNPMAPMVVFGHGWNRTGADFIQVAEVLGQRCHCIMLDLPGFGETPRPSGAWGTQEYADAVLELLSGFERPYLWVGHSFGGRIGLRLAAMDAQNLTALVLVGAAGLPRKRQGVERLRYLGRKYGYQILRRFADSAGREKLRRRFSSADYLLRPDLQDIFIKTVQEDQTEALASIKTAATILVGEHDSEAPPEISRRLHQGIAGSSLIELPGVGHIDAMMRSRHMIAKVILEHLEVSR